MRVLVAEDVHRLADDIAEGLRDHGMAVDVAYDGTSAMGKLAVNAYDVLVVDRDLPGVHGDTICRRIAEDELAVMVLMLTAAGTPGERVAGLSLGADDYLAKPFHFPELVLRIHALARRKPDVHARVLRFADIELDPAKRSARRSGVTLELTPKEFAVLEVLLRSESGVVSAEELLERAWDEHADPFTRTVSVTISRLRRRLGDPPVIETVAGLGYRLVK
jgi:DNA-binding response OmpR family regulator